MIGFYKKVKQNQKSSIFQHLLQNSNRCFNMGVRFRHIEISHALDRSGHSGLFDDFIYSSKR